MGGNHIGLRGQNDEPQARFGPSCSDLGHLAQIWAIRLRYGLICSDLGHIAWIWAIRQNLGQKRPQRRQSPEDGAGGDKQTDGRTEPLAFYRNLFPSGPLPYSPLTLITHHSSRARVPLTTLCLWAAIWTFPPSNPSFEAKIMVSRPKSQSWGPNPSLEAQILALRLKS